MSVERQLIDYINNIYKSFEEHGLVLDNEHKMAFETGVANGITFALRHLIIHQIDLSVLGQYQSEED